VHDELEIPTALVYELVTSRPARLLRLGSGEGAIYPGSKADLIVTRDKQLTPAQTLVELTWSEVEMVMHAGRIVLVSPALADRIPAEFKDGMQLISIDGMERLIRVPLSDLWMQTVAALGRTPAVSGRQLSVEVNEPSHELVPLPHIARSAEVTSLRDDCHRVVI
jgi:hypothetical protein